MAANLNESFQVLQDLLNKSTSSVYSFDKSYIKNFRALDQAKLCLHVLLEIVRSTISKAKEKILSVNLHPH